MTEAFTDKDLEWWKAQHQSPMSKALLARLESAEKVCLAVGDCLHKDHSGNCQSHWIDNPCPMEIWKKSKGL